MPRLFVREWRWYRALSQADLAQQAGITEATISRLEQPDAPPARPSTVRKMAASLGIAPHELYAPPPAERPTES